MEIAPSYVHLSACFELVGLCCSVSKVRNVQTLDARRVRSSMIPQIILSVRPDDRAKSHSSFEKDRHQNLIQRRESYGDKKTNGRRSLLSLRRGRGAGAAQGLGRAGRESPQGSARLSGQMKPRNSNGSKHGTRCWTIQTSRSSSGSSARRQTSSTTRLTGTSRHTARTTGVDLGKRRRQGLDRTFSYYAMNREV